MRALYPSVCLAVLLVGAVSGAERWWERFPVAGSGRVPSLGVNGGQYADVRQVAVDAEGGVWVLGGRGCHYWDSVSKEWRKPDLGSDTVGGLVAHLHGCAAGAYLTRRDARRPTGTIYRLLGGTAQELTSYQFGALTSPEEPYFCRDGRILNWCDGLLRVWQNGAWRDSKADLVHGRVVVLEGKDAVTLYCDGKLYVVDDEGALTPVEPQEELGVVSVQGAMWGENRAVFLGERNRVLWGLDLTTWRRAELPRGSALSRGQAIRELVPMQDGSVVFVTRSYSRQGDGLYRLLPDGTVESIRTAVPIRWSSPPPSLRPGALAVAPDGTLWVAGRPDEVACLRDGKLRVFDSEADQSPVWSCQFAFGRDGVVYVAGSDELYAYTDHLLPTGLPRRQARELTSLGPALWKWQEEGDPRWIRRRRVGDLALVGAHHGRDDERITGIDLRDGRPRFSIPVRHQDTLCFSATEGKAPGEVLLRLFGRLVVIRADSGEVLLEIPLVGGWSGEPAPFALPGDRVLLPFYDEVFLCVDAKGKDVWRVGTGDLGRAVSRPALHGTRIVVQSSLGYQRERHTFCMDSESGEVLWSVQSEGYGCGLAFDSGGDRLFEAASVRAEGRSSAALSCRDPSGGKILWHRLRPGAPLPGAPLVDARTGRLYVGAIGGGVACLDGRNGEVLWETQLPRKFAGAGTLWFMRPSDAVGGTGIVLAMDQCRVLSVLSAVDGTVLRSFRLEERGESAASQLSRSTWHGGPWFVDDLLVKAVDQEFRAYKLPINELGVPANPK